MLLLAFILGLASLVAASPIVIDNEALSTMIAERESYAGNTSLEKRADDTANDVVDKICRPVTLIFARGTFEPGNMGIVIGPPFETSLQSAFGNSSIAVQGVEYRAAVGGNFNVDNNPGIAPMVDSVNKAISQCPSTQLVLSGYSQGGFATHGALKKLSTSQLRYVKAVVLFGDEAMSDPITAVPTSSVKQFCAEGDSICEKENYVIRRPHLGYASDAKAAAEFCKTKIKI